MQTDPASIQDHLSVRPFPPFFEKIVEIFEVEPYELYKFPTSETTKDIKNKLFNALEKDDKLLELVYKFYQVVK